MIPFDNAQASQNSRDVWARGPDTYFRVLAYLARNYLELVGVDVESSDVIIVAMEEKLLVAILVVDNAKRCGVVHDLAVDVVEEVVANATPRVTVHEGETQRVLSQPPHLIGLALVVGANVVRGRKG